jgi:hypothetical protein
MEYFAMAKTPQKLSDERPDAWERFEKAVDSAIKSGPKHRDAAPKTVPKKKSRRSRLG